MDFWRLARWVRNHQSRDLADGDLVYVESGALRVLAVGTTDQVLTAAPGAAHKLKWAASSGGTGGGGGAPSGPAGGDLSGTYPDPSISSSVITTAARTVLDDVTVAAMLATLGGVPTTRTISTTAPLTGGGDLSADRTIAVSNATTGAVGVVQLEANSADTSASHVVTANDTRLSDARAPTGTAGGDLKGTYPNPKIEAAKVYALIRGLNW